jgi:uncharacterized protein
MGTMAHGSPVDVLDGIQIVDADSHFTEPADLWTSRVPSKMRDQVPQMRTIDGVTGWYLEDTAWSSIGGNVIGEGNHKEKGVYLLPADEIAESAWDVAARLRLMDEMGIWAAVIYPNGIGFTSNHIFEIGDEAQRALVLQTYNDFYVDIQEESKMRLVPQAILPIWDMDATVKEMERLLSRGIRGFTLADRAELLGLPQLPEPYYEPMWSLADEAGAVMNFHIGAGVKRTIAKGDDGALGSARFEKNAAVTETAWTSFSLQRKIAVVAALGGYSNMRVVTNFCASDMFDRYPNLKIVSAESGIGWVPYILESIEFQLDEQVSDPNEKGRPQRRPTEYFRDHFYVTFWYEQTAPELLLDAIGVNNVLVETDIPHPSCLYPGAREHFAKVLGGVDAHSRQRILQDNAAELYKLEVPVQQS